MFMIGQLPQGRRRVFRSGPADGAIEEVGESTRGGLLPLSFGGGGWGGSPDKFLNFERFYVRF